MLVGGLTAVLARGAAEDQLDRQAQSVRSAFLGSVERQAASGNARRERAAVEAARPVARSLDARVSLVGRRTPVQRTEGTRSYRFPLEGRGAGALVVAVSTEPLEEANRTAALSGLLAGLTAAGMLLLLGRLLTASVARPLTDLRKAMTRAASGDYRPTRLHRGPRELRSASEDFDHLMKAIAARQSQLEDVAATDPLTGVGSRRRFHEALEVEFQRARREKGQMAVLKLDLDGFRTLNDARGTAAGDDVLRQVADVLRGQVRATDVIARLGADHFGLILPGSGADVVLAAAERARVAVETGGGGVELSCSAGLACYPTDAGETSTLLQAADGALAWAKRSGGGQIRGYDPDEVVLSANEEQHAEVLELLRRPRPVEPVYQPIVRLATGQLCGYEGLARFPGVAERSPAAWFAQAHRCGLGAQLEARALEAILDHPARPENTFLSVNLSPSTLSSDEVQAALPEDMTGIVVEITEQERVLQDAELKQQLDILRRRGAQIAVDDAGAGYAGLNQVMRIQPDIIKLDRSLVDGVNDDIARGALIDSFVRFARRTGACVCAEGIERPEDLRALADLDVTYGQGYALGRPARPWVPVSMEVVAPLLRRSLRTGTALSTDPEIADSSERRLEQIVERLSEVTSLAELETGLGLIAAELDADEAALLRYDADRGRLEAVSDHRWMSRGERIKASDYRTTADVLRSREVIQVMFSDGAADLGELALLGTTGHRALMVAPVVLHAEPLGVLMVFAATERPWSRSDSNRARIMAYQLGAVTEALAPPGARGAIGSQAHSSPV